MKLQALQLLFRVSAGICCATQCVNRIAGRFHQWAWTRCTAANLATCNERQPARERFT